jgi:hypothetical protein
VVMALAGPAEPTACSAAVALYTGWYVWADILLAFDYPRVAVCLIARSTPLWGCEHHLEHCTRYRGEGKANPSA